MAGITHILSGSPDFWTINSMKNPSHPLIFAAIFKGRDPFSPSICNDSDVWLTL